MFATNDGTDNLLRLGQCGPSLEDRCATIYLFTRTGYDDQVVPGYGFPPLAPELVLTLATRS